MSDHDPFAQNPYVPPSQRGDGDAQDQSPTTDDAAAAPQDGAATHDPVDEALAPQEASAPEPAAAPTDTTEQTVEVPAERTAEQTAVTEQVPTEAPTATDATTPESPAADPYVHRYEPPAAQDPTAPVTSTAADGTTTESLPPVVAAGLAEEAAPPAGFAGAGDGSGGGYDGGAPTAEEPKPRKRRGRKVAGGVAIAVLAAACGVGGAAAYDGIKGDDDSTVSVSSLDTPTSGSTAPTNAVEKVASSVLPSVVQINVSGSSESGTGSGIIISSNGEILTNNHVVAAAGSNGKITVSFNDNTTAKATVLGTDKVTDLAVIKADKTGLTPAQLGTSKDLKVGQEVVAIGSPFGLESTVTSGIVSALNRPVTSSDESGSDSTVFPAVQTDAAINPGNSGGPLVDLDGRVIAINSAIQSSTSSSGGGEAGSIGLGFAIPIDLAKNVAKHLEKGEKVEHARIGISVTPATESDGITTIGAEVQSVDSGGAGAKAGLKKGDIITAVDGNPVGSSDGLVASIRGYEPGDKVTLTYLRDGKKNTVSVTLDSDGGDLSS